MAKIRLFLFISLLISTTSHAEQLGMKTFLNVRCEGGQPVVAETHRSGIQVCRQSGGSLVDTNDQPCINMFVGFHNGSFTVNPATKQVFVGDMPIGKVRVSGNLCAHEPLQPVRIDLTPGLSYSISLQGQGCTGFRWLDSFPTYGYSLSFSLKGKTESAKGYQLSNNVANCSASPKYKPLVTKFQSGQKQSAMPIEAPVQTSQSASENSVI